MNDGIDFERYVVDQFANVPPVWSPDSSVDPILSAASRMRPLPRWLAEIKEPPMRLHSNLVVGSPVARQAVAVVIVVLLALGAVGAAVAAATLLPSPNQHPPHNGLIAFDTADGNIWVAGPDGSNPRLLVDRPNLVHGPSWSPDGSKLAFYENVGGGAYLDPAGSYQYTDTSRIHVVNADGSGDVLLTNGDPIMPLHGFGNSFSGGGLAWSPDSSKIATSLVRFAANGKDGLPSIVVLSLDGTAVEPLGEDFAGLDPAWSPDGDRLAFRGGTPGADETTGVWVVRPDGSDLVKVASGPEPAYALDAFAFTAPQWSLDGSELAYSIWADDADGENLGIWVVGADGSNAHVLVDDPGWQEFFPGWSPDGQSVAYQRYPRNIDPIPGYEVLTVPSTGGKPTQLQVGAAGTDGNGALQWAPDGTAILTVSGSGNETAADWRPTLVSMDPSVQPTFVDLPSGTRSEWNGWAGVSWQPTN